MYKKNNAFTIIELVAVLVILSIVVLILTPIILDIKSKVKSNAYKRSIDGYGKAIELAIANNLIDKGTIPTDLSTLKIEYTGDEVKCNIMQIKENGKVYLSKCTVNNIEVRDKKTDDGWYHYGSTDYQTMTVNNLIFKANPVTVTNYTDGNTKEMYTFEHPATEQTGALTDYRYIGANPNNYVTFNNELWRIIGAFTVEDGTGNSEQRIKIVRNEKLLNNMKWDSTSPFENQWSSSSLNEFLNGEYYDGLDDESKEMIANTKFYLGGKSYDSTTDYGTAPDMYAWERGTTVYSGRDITWNGKIAIMYPSDYTYTYALGVNNTCYTNGYICNGPTNGWIYNSNSNSYQFLLSANSSNPDAVFAVSSSGIIIYDYVAYSYGVRPTLYLKSSVKIILGDGSEQNPYQLSM